MGCWRVSEVLSPRGCRVRVCAVSAELQERRYLSPRRATGILHLFVGQKRKAEENALSLLLCSSLWSRTWRACSISFPPAPRLRRLIRLHGYSFLQSGPAYGALVQQRPSAHLLSSKPALDQLQRKSGRGPWSPPDHSNCWHQAGPSVRVAPRAPKFSPTRLFLHKAHPKYLPPGRCGPGGGGMV